MATHDYNLANQSGSAFRSDLNFALAAIVSQNSSATEPATKFAYQYWVDTSVTPALIKQRNSANDAWITLSEVGGQLLVADGTQAKPGIAFASDVDTGLKRNSANVISIVTNGANRITVKSDGYTGIGTASPTEKLEVDGNVKGTSFIGNVTGNVDGIVGGTTPAAVTGTTITANSSFVGNLTGDVTGNVTGNLTGVASDADDVKRATWSGSATWKDLAAWSATSDAYEHLSNATEGYVQISGNGKLRASGSIQADAFNGTLGNGDVRDATASSSVGNKGTYAFCTLRDSNADRAAGYTASGSVLRYSNANGDVSGIPSGSWRLMGRLSSSSGNSEPQETSLWLRYA